MRLATVLALSLAFVTLIATIDESRAQRQNPRPAADQARQWDAAIQKALTEQQGSVAKSEWARIVGTEHPAYAKAGNNMPPGYGIAQPRTAQREVEAARAEATRKAEARARDSLRQQGRNSNAQAVRARIQLQDDAVMQANRELASRHDSFAKAFEEDDRAAMEAIAAEARSVPGTTPRTRAQMERDYTNFINGLSNAGRQR